jgi:hypothetical protein
VRTAALLSGKALANALLGAAIVLAALVGCAVVLAIQGKVAFALGPFVIVWGLLLLPTFFLWTTFVAATYAITNNRFATYAIGLAVMVITGWAQLRARCRGPTTGTCGAPRAGATSHRSSSTRFP